jgi:hypothetical protein
LAEKIVGNERGAGVALAEVKISGNRLNGGEIQEMINCTEGAAAKWSNFWRKSVKGRGVTKGSTRSASTTVKIRDE